MKKALLAVGVVLGAGILLFGVFTLYTNLSVQKESQADVELNNKIAELEQKIANLSAEQASSTSQTIESTTTDQSRAAIDALKDTISALKKQKVQQAAVSTAIPAPATQATSESVFSKTDLIAKIGPSVFYISDGVREGSAFAVSKNLLLTNYHVIEGSYAVKVKSANRAQNYAYLVAYNKDVDLALLEYPSADLAPLVFSSSDKTAVVAGQNIYVFGYPFGGADEVSFKEGSISRRFTNEGTEYLEISATLSPGNSGGPIVDQKGQIVGVSTATYGTTMAGVSLGDGIKLAIPSDIASQAYQKLLASRKIFDDEHKLAARQLIDFNTKYSTAENDFQNGLTSFNKAISSGADTDANKADSIFAGIPAETNYLRDKNNKAYPTQVSFSDQIDATLKKLESIAVFLHTTLIPSQLRINQARRTGANDVVYNETIYFNSRVDEYQQSLEAYNTLRENLQTSIKAYFGI